MQLQQQHARNVLLACPVCTASCRAISSAALLVLG
jgi:hypothetical protein